MPRTRALVLAGLLVAAATTGCTLSSDPASDSVGRLHGTGSAHEEGARLLGTDPEAPTIEVSAPPDKVRFDKGKLTAKPGVTNVRFSTDGHHNFLLIGIGFDEPLLWGKRLGGAADVTHAVELAVGDYQYFCSVPGHKENGMVGVLTVA